ncbi:MAG: hypothetical protein ABUL42_02205 [Terricaulis silvestris]
MRLLPLLCVIALAACGRQAPPATSASTATPAPALTQAATPAPWFICDGLDAPSVFVLTKDAAGTKVTLAEYNKTGGGEAARQEFDLGESEGAAGSVYFPLQQNGAETGAARALNPGMLDEPGAAYTQPFTSLKLGDRQISCRWLSRTRVFGFTSRRSFAVTEDADGDLIYTTYNFADAAKQQPIDLSGSQRTTTFSLEVRGGSEQLGPAGAAYHFENNGYSYDLSAPQAGAAQLVVKQASIVQQAEPIIAFQTGTGAP